MRVYYIFACKAEAMVSLCSFYGWTYISLLYNEGSYGENGGIQVGEYTNM